MLSRYRMLLISDPEKINSFELQHIMNYPKQRLQTNLFYNTISNIVQREVTLTGGIESKNAEWETYWNRDDRQFCSSINNRIKCQSGISELSRYNI